MNPEKGALLRLLTGLKFAEGRRRSYPTERNTARDIARGAYENVIGPHTQTHRRDR